MLIHGKLRGFSLIELIVGVVIIGMLFALAMPNLSGWIQNQKIRTAAESILNGLQVARSEAVKNNGTARLVLCDLPASSWEVVAASATAAAPAASLACGAASTAIVNEVRVQERSSQEGSRTVQVTVTPAGQSIVTFNRLGRIINTTITDIDISAASGVRPLRITVSTGGTLRMCDPSTLLSASDPRAC